MLRPKRMSKLSVTGSKQVMGSVVEVVHDANVLDVSEYDGSWDGFEPGDPEGEAEQASERLVTVRSIESMLGVDAESVDADRPITDAEIEEQLPEIRDRVNELDDERDALRDELRGVEERLDEARPFVDLGIDLNLLSGYDSLDVAVGRGDEESIERVLLDADGVQQYEIFSGDDVLAVFVYPSEHAEDVLDDALVGAAFTAIDVPDAEVAPESYVRELESEKQRIESDIADLEDELDELRSRHAEFLLAAEEHLSIQVQKAEAPLSFATTANAFVAEGWIPTEEYERVTAMLKDDLGDRIEVEEVERAAFKSDGEAVHEHGEAVADGGTTIGSDEPPVVQDNNGLVQPFEVLVEAIGRPNYREFDPTALLFLTFPLMFGFMIGDVGYGLVYTAIGGYLYTQFDSRGFKSMGGVTIAAGLFTIVFGVLYGEIFGLHLVSEWVWGGHSPLHKGLIPKYGYWVPAWILISAMAALVHLNIGYVLGFFEELQFHGLREAATEKLSWILAMNGLWVFIASRWAEGSKPDFIFTAFDSGPEAAFALEFSGFPVIVGQAGIGVFVLGAALLAMGSVAELVEIFDTLVNVLSYARLAAVLLAKAGMAFAVNLFFFGVYVDEGGGWHFGHSGMPDAEAVAALGPGETLGYHGYEVTEIMFGGLMHGGIASLLGGIVILVFGHLLVLALGVTSAGLQAVRLEYYEFFSKFFDGGGREYEPFGHERVHSRDE
ncbi:V-type ATP synthase subunit I [Halolamina sp. CBA1230]|uniref:V-type ATP synthase subunit I n=1 Tax=Halolamina sp. CBA1230 TaxID=1853690 RepID=UPI0009A2098D|nr:V-type ATP synthase subunit I [Halolamina sp. CBA1230]QKY20842.1 V-type ATP synthase subunit I [Halolamina sp. CBA1230]